MNKWENAECIAERAYHHYESGQWEQALFDLKRALTVNPHQCEWHFGMGLTLNALQRYEEAAACFQRVLNIRGEDSDTMLHLAIDLIQCDRCPNALEVLSRITEIESDYEPAYCYQILAHARLGQHEQAELSYYLARQIIDECPQCYDHIAHSLLRKGDHERAIWCWEKTLTIDPRCPYVQANLGRAYWAKGKPSRARQLFMRQLRHTPDDVDTMMDLGTLLMEGTRYTEAGETFRRVTEQEPAQGEAYLRLGELALLTDHIDTAERQFRMAQQLQPTESLVHLRLAEVARRRGQVQRARHHLRRELQIEYERPEPVLELARLLVELQMARSVVELLTPLLADDGPASMLYDMEHRASALIYRAAAHMLQGANQKAARDCRRALRLTPRNPTATFNLILAYVELGRYKLAWHRFGQLAAVPHDDTNLRSLRLRLIQSTFKTSIRRVLTSLPLCSR